MNALMMSDGRLCHLLSASLPVLACSICHSSRPHSRVAVLVVPPTGLPRRPSSGNSSRSSSGCRDGDGHGRGGSRGPGSGDGSTRSLSPLVEFTALLLAKQQAYSPSLGSWSSTPRLSDT